VVSVLEQMATDRSHKHRFARVPNPKIFQTPPETGILGHCLWCLAGDALIEVEKIKRMKEIKT
jgi:hypothetical protein